MTPEAWIAELEAENTTLREQVKLLAHKALEFCDPFVWRHATMLRLLRKSG
jgi:hypothetical protein